MKKVFAISDSHIRKKYNAQPCYITMNLPALLEALNTVGIKNPIICSSISKIGFRMSWGKTFMKNIIKCKSLDQ